MWVVSNKIVLTFGVMTAIISVYFNLIVRNKAYSQNIFTKLKKERLNAQHR